MRHPFKKAESEIWIGKRPLNEEDFWNRIGDIDFNSIETLAPELIQTIADLHIREAPLNEFFEDDHINVEIIFREDRDEENTVSDNQTQIKYIKITINREGRPEDKVYYFHPESGKKIKESEILIASARKKITSEFP